MKKFLCLLFVVCAALSFAQEDDFFSDSIDSVLQRAREKNRGRTEGQSEDKERAIDLVQDYSTEDEAKDDAVAKDASDVEDDGSALSDTDGKTDVTTSDAHITLRDKFRSKRLFIVHFFDAGDLGWLFSKPSKASASERPAKPVRPLKPSRPAAQDEKDVAPKAAEFEQPKAEAPYSPFVLSLLPGISMPMGINRTSLGLGIIGGMTEDTRGIAVSSVFDIVLGELTGIQSAGVFSTVGGKGLGIQSSGVFNVAGSDFYGLQNAGVFNVTRDDFLGLQSAGVFNMGRDVVGVQTAGVFNTSRNLKGLQVAGVFNSATDVKGIQVAGVVNAAKDVRGLQVGLVNISENCYGLPIGLVNYVKNGVRDIGFWHDSADNLYAYWANGTNNLYTIVYGGEAPADWFVNSNTLSFGFGLGYRVSRKPFSLDLDLSVKNFYGPNWDDALRAADVVDSYGNHVFSVSPISSFPSLRASLGMPIFKGLEVFGGVSADIGISGVCAVPDALKRDSSFLIRGQEGHSLEINPQLFWGLRL